MKKNKSKEQKILDEINKPIVPRAPHRPTRMIKDKSKYDKKKERRNKWN